MDALPSPMPFVSYPRVDLILPPRHDEELYETPRPWNQGTREDPRFGNDSVVACSTTLNSRDTCELVLVPLPPPSLLLDLLSYIPVSFLHLPRRLGSLSIPRHLRPPGSGPCLPVLWYKGNSGLGHLSLYHFSPSFQIKSVLLTERVIPP